ncbi:uncharacterized protein LOC102705767 [Oryza brachyantha]|uniref:Uncharacterized protein n=1 Tax=Oryza brachyantha TaxID=4533 RepID=J3NBG2_ORYBR|nr:uncharacterized protein LOC102705767 [Oryza brachyantha]
MGNCLVIQDSRSKEIKIMSMDDGEILKLPPPPPPSSSSPLNAREVLGVVSDGVLPAAAVVRVKLVVSKQELRKMLLLHHDGLSMEDMVSSLVQKELADEADDEQESCSAWRPTLQSIPEGSVF